MTTLERMQTECDRLATEWGTPPVTVSRNNRLRTTGGRYMLMSHNIELAGWLFDAPDEYMLDVTRHEFAHHLALILHGRNVDHDYRWRECADAVGAEPSSSYPRSLNAYNNGRSGARARAQIIRRQDAEDARRHAEAIEILRRRAG